jgi:hypothetical protein
MRLVLISIAALAVLAAVPAGIASAQPGPGWYHHHHRWWWRHHHHHVCAWRYHRRVCWWR